MISFFTTLSNKALAPTGNTWEFSGPDNNLCLSLQSQFLYAFDCYYKNGRTYLATRKNHVSSDGRAGIFEYYNNNVSLQFFNDVPTAVDYHDNTVIQIDSTGIITMIHAQHSGQDDYNDVWKMGAAYDITSFTKQANAPNDSGNYPKFYRVTDDNYFLIGRVLTKATSPTEHDIYITPYDGSSWGTPIKMIDVDPEGGDQVTLYPYGLHDANGEKSEWIYFRWIKRIDVDPVINYRDRYIAKCNKSDFYTWHNLEETFSKDVSSGAITETEANANFRYTIDNVSGDRNVTAKNYLETNGDIRLIEYVGGYQVLNQFINKTLQSPQDLITQDILMQPIVKTNADYGIFSKDESGVLYRYHSSDLLTWVKAEKIYEHTDGIGSIHIPFNYSEIPYGEKFAIFASTNKYNSDTGDSIVDSPNSNNYIVIEMIK